MIAFCGVCHSGMGFSPVVEGRTFHFSAGGLYDGVVILVDDETQSYWNHITGRCLHGPMKGARIEPFGVEMTDAGAERGRGDGDPLARRAPEPAPRGCAGVANPLRPSSGR